MAAAWAWARKEACRRWRGLGALVLMIGLLTAVALNVLAGARRTESAYDRFRQQTLARDVAVQVDDPDLLDRYDDVFALDEVDVGAQVALFPSFSDLERGFDIGVLASPSRVYGTEVDRSRLLEGRRPHPDRANEVILDEATAEQLGAATGATVTLATFSPEQLERIEEEFSGRAEGPALRLRVVGIGRLPDDLHGDEADLNIVATPAFHERYRSSIGHFTGLASFRLREGPTDVPAFEREVERVFGSESELQVTSAAEESEQVHDAIGVLGVGLSALGFVAALAAIVAGGYALSNQLQLGAEDQPTLAALGMTRPERAAGIVLVAVPVAIGAALVSGAAAVAASPLFPVDIARRAEPAPGFALDSVAIGVGVAAVATLVLVAAGITGWHVARPRAGAAVVGRRPALSTRLAAGLHLRPSAVVGTRMALQREIGPHAVPVHSTLAGATLGVAGILAVVVFGASLDRLLDSPSRYGSNWDLTPDLTEEDAERVLAQPYVGDVGVVHLAQVRAGGRLAQGYAMSTVDGDPGFTLRAGREPVDDREVALGVEQLTRLGVGIGDGVALTGASGTKPSRFVVVGEVIVPGFDDDPIADGVLLTTDALDAVRQNDGSDQPVLNWRPGTDPSEALRRFRKEFPGAVSAYSRPRPTGEVANLGRVDNVPRALAGFLAVVAVAAVTHALVTAVRSRRRELAVLRCLGFVRSQVRGAVVWQATTIAICALVLGIPVGLGVGRWAWALVADRTGVATDAAMPLVALAVLAAAAVAAANILAAAPAWLAARANPARALRVE